MDHEVLFEPGEGKPERKHNVAFRHRQYLVKDCSELYNLELVAFSSTAGRGKFGNPQFSTAYSIIL